MRTQAWRHGTWLAVSMIVLTCLQLACRPSELLLDGLYGGVTDTISTVVSDALLVLLGQDPSGA